MVSVGIDVSKGKSTVCLMRPFGEIVAGPYHPAFGQLVKSHIAYNRLVKMALESKDNTESKIFTAYVPKEELSDYIGQRKCNVERLKKQFGYQKVIIKSIN